MPFSSPKTTRICTARRSEPITIGNAMTNVNGYLRRGAARDLQRLGGMCTTSGTGYTSGSSRRLT